MVSLLSALVAVQTCLLFFTGAVLRFEDTPVYWEWATYLNFLRYSWGALMLNQFKDTLSDDGSVPVIQGIPVLEYYGLTDATIASYSGILSVFAVVLFLGTWAVLHFRTFTKR